MYITKIELENIKVFDHFVWELDEGEDPAGWHVLLGVNGAGKSTVVRAASMALMGSENVSNLRANLSNWARYNEEEGQVSVTVTSDISSDKLDLDTEQTRRSTSRIKFFFDLFMEANYPDFFRRIFEDKEKGCFAAAFEPFRRFTGGNPEQQKLFKSAPIAARYLSAFGEDVALSEPLEWLKQLKFEQLEDPSSVSGKLLSNVIAFINQNDFLPNSVKLESVSSKGVFFKDTSRNIIGIEELSDGYRSVMSLMLELIRQLVQCFATAEIFDEACTQVTMPGVVFIDEVDVHLHPSWQRQIGHCLTRHFPRIQFIVTTHSALICQSAVNGSVWKLPGVDDSDQGGRVTGLEFNRLVYGNLVEAYNSGAFGPNIERSEKAQQMLEELAELNVLADFESLDAKQKRRQEELSNIFALNSNIKG